MLNSSSKTYCATSSRLFGLWVWPLLIQSVFFFTYASSLEKIIITAIANWVILSLWLTMTIGVFSLLFLNHIRYAKGARITINGKQIILEQLSQSLPVSFSEIQSVTEYSVGKMPWSGVFFWKIKTSEKEFVISSLTISRNNFERYFYNKTVHVTSFFPVLPIS